jgi:hypothetical protein
VKNLRIGLDSLKYREIHKIGSTANWAVKFGMITYDLYNELFRPFARGSLTRIDR